MEINTIHRLASQCYFINTTTTTTASTTVTGRTNYFMKRKRKSQSSGMAATASKALETVNELNSRRIMRETSQHYQEEAEQLSNLTIANDATGGNNTSSNSGSVCLICRQHMTECCLKCCQHFTKATRKISTDNNKSRNSLNNNKNNNNNNDSRTVTNDKCHYSESVTTAAATTTTTAGGNCRCCWPQSSCATSSTISRSSSRGDTTAAAAAATTTSQQLPTTELSCSSNSVDINQFSRCQCNCKSLKTSTTKETTSPAVKLMESSSSSSSSRATASSLTTSSTPAPNNVFELLPSATTPSSANSSPNGKVSNSHTPNTSSATTTTTTIRSSAASGTNDNNQITNKSANNNHKQTSSVRVLLRNAIRTFQLLLVIIQMQLMQTIYNKLNNNPHQNTNTNYNYNNLNKRQQRPPLPRLKFRRNSYCNNATTNNSSNTNNVNASHNTTPPLQAHHHQQPQPQPTHHRVQLPPHLRYFKMPNLSHLYMILIVLSFLSLFLPSTHAQTSLVLPSSASSSGGTIPIATSSQVRLSRNETVCKSMDIRNTPSQFSQLENCTVIEGFLLMTLVNTHNQAEFTQVFPLLTEVTEFIMVYRVHNLRSLSQIFPNLSIIRGGNLFEGYALVVYSNPHLEDFGLTKLTTISRGGVRIENNLSLCFVKTIDWTQIVSNTTDIIMDNNRADQECPQCPGDTKTHAQEGATENGVCKEYHGHRHCWNSKSCQKICPERCRNNCVDENTCCNESCLGGCSPDNLNECSSCRHFSIYNNTCTDKCPANYYSYLDRRCLTAESCARIGTKFENNKQETLVAYKGVCTTRCPDKYNKIDSTCQLCGDKCLKKCVGGVIDSVARAKEYHGCTHIIKEGLTISIKRGARHLMEDLEFGLSSIEVISTFLKVQGTFGINSLQFFKNLKKIEGDTLCEDKFALYVLENNELEKLWEPNQTVRIESGRVFFHFNPKLCYVEIEALQPMMKNNATFDKNEVATDSNGSKGSCNTEFLNATIYKSGARMAVLDIMNPLKFEDERTFIGYQYFYIEDKNQNVPKHGFRPCEDGWVASEPTKETRYLITNLEPYTQYAYYVKTMTISSDPRNAQSPIQWFTTKPAQPEIVRKLRAYANSSSEIIVNWLPPKTANGKLVKYNVRAILDKRNQLESRNYCKDPLKEAGRIDGNFYLSKVPVTEKPQVTDCKCTKDGTYDDEKTDASRHEGISFENAVQNFVYVKQTNATRSSSKSDGGAAPSSATDADSKRRRRRETEFDTDGESFLIRHMRSLPYETTTIEPTEIASNVTANETRMDETGMYYLEYSFEVNASTTEFVFKRLKHFSMYMLGIEACREPAEGAPDKECSNVMQIDVRTSKLINVDKVENLSVSLESNNTSRSNIRLRWDPPMQPNGAVVSYTIIYGLLAQDAVEEKKCITELDYRNMTNGYVLTDLSTGNYSIRVRANSLAGEGVESEAVSIYIPPTTISTMAIVFICVGVILFISTIVFGIFYARKKWMATPSDLKMFPTVNPYYISLQYIPDDWEVPRERVLQLSPLGQGSFGMVYEGILKGCHDDTPCAIKTVNENATDRERMNFLNEASVMKQFDTYHVVRLLGVCSRGQPALVVMELMKNGDLKSYLRAHRPDEREPVPFGLPHGLILQPPPLSRIYQMAIEIADGMAYLAAKKFVHRDLAARNCMVAEDLTVKIGDFGMTRDIYETDYYRKGTKGLLPVRWMPPESLRDGVYSSASDVFSYGVVLWEMSTLASQPYQGYSNDQVLRYVIDGGVMVRPENCPDKLYRLMEKCWLHRPSARPSFMDIIRFLMDTADPHFRDVAFFHSEEGKIVRSKEKSENMRHSGDVFNDNDNDMDDVTTPLRVGEYNEYKMNMDNNSSVENYGDSPMVIDDDHPHSPYSLGSAIIVSSTPDGQSKNSFNLSQMSHNNPTLSSAPSTSAGVISGTAHLQHPHQPRQLHQPFHGRYQLHSQNHGDDAAAYVQPDFDPNDFQEDEEVAAKSAETDERGYEIYDPSPNYRQHAPFGASEHEEEEDLETLGSGRAGKLSGGQSLLPRQKGRQRVPTIMPMSSSMPDEVISAPITSLHPSTASAASSNASSTTTAGKYPSLKKAVADTVQNVGNSLMPMRLRNINRRFFNHKRSGSNASHKSTSSNPNTSSNSNTNLTGGGRGKSMSGQNLGTIESGGSGSAGSYVAAPRFFTPSSASTSDNPNYKLLDESANASGISAAAVAEAENATTPPSKKTTKAKTGFSESTNPNYQLLESLNTSDMLQRQPSIPSLVGSSENPNYIMMSALPPAPVAHVSENPNYHGMDPGHGRDAPIMWDTQAELGRTRFNSSATSCSSSSSSSHAGATREHDVVRPFGLAHMTSRSQSPTKKIKHTKTTPCHTTTANSPAIAAAGAAVVPPTATALSLKEKWLRQSQAEKTQPPPNGFIGREFGNRDRDRQGSE